jgi:hypothetical protein
MMRVTARRRNSSMQEHLRELLLSTLPDFHVMSLTPRSTDIEVCPGDDVWAEHDDNVTSDGDLDELAADLINLKDT